MAGPSDNRADGRVGGDLHFARRHQSGYLGRRSTDDADSVWDWWWHLSWPSICCPGTFRFQMQFRSQAPPEKLNAVNFHFDWNDRYKRVERLDRRNVSGAGLFRLRSVASAALSHRQVHRTKPAESPLQRDGQDPDAVFHFVHRGYGVRVFLSLLSRRCYSSPWNCGMSRAIRAFEVSKKRYEQAFEERKDAAEKYLASKKHSHVDTVSETRSASSIKRTPPASNWWEKTFTIPTTFFFRS